MTADSLQVRQIGGMRDVDAQAWDALAHHDNPFVAHAFLALLEETKCTGGRSGWEPMHLVVTRANERGEHHVVGGMPLYRRANSLGEYIFDWGWAQAAERARLRYYPKLTCAVPFTPATGPRLLVHPSELAKDGGRAVRTHLLAAALECAREDECSSLHVLYPRDDECTFLTETGLMRRKSLQFHWRNDSYATFDAFLERMAHGDRKEIRRERRKVNESGAQVRVQLAREVDAKLWPRIFALYTSTSDRKWGSPYLTRAFFSRLPEVLGESGVVALADKDGELAAMTLSFERGAHLYGRYWGTSVDVPGLHFELCYYRLIDRAIEKRMTLVEAGAQGEHKLKRGFLPVVTHSAHFIAHEKLRAGIAHFLADEARIVDAEIAEYSAHGPFKDGTAPNRPSVAGVDDL